ncbi:uncharacterized protein LOC114857907 [Betta splendens]|uniref:Uncharacterized protein LOC114857907 n=1 Tax=Betta splendens TaxID=158456 RepID=A0A9W2XUW4_BETSP|nr:uncharacterized protein LOC114857907 [Betta splendens]
MMGSVSKTVSAVAPHGKDLFLSRLKNEIIKSPLASNVLLGLILTGLENFIDMEFACPCDPAFNAFFASVYLFFPGVTASVLMLVTQGCRCKAQQELEKVLLIGSVPVIMWLVLVFLDGEYFACAKTYWSGRYVIVDKAEPQRWCEPTNSTSYMERMRLTQRWYFQSQVMGIVVLIGSLALFGLFKCSQRLFIQRPEERATGLRELIQEEEFVVNLASSSTVS